MFLINISSILNISPLFLKKEMVALCEQASWFNSSEICSSAVTENAQLD